MRQSWKIAEQIVQHALERAGIVLLEIPRVGGKWVQGSIIPARVACDFVGAISDTGRMFVCDVKKCENECRFALALPEHQRRNLIAVGQAGAISGLLIDASAELLSLWYWLDWGILAVPGLRSVQWTDERLLCLGPDNQMPDVSVVLHRS